MSFDPGTLRFTKSHEWVHLDGETATVGISDYAVKELTDLVYIELPAVGKMVQAGEVFGVVESVKAASDLYAPVAGEVVAANVDLENDLGLLSSDPYGAGWMIKLRVSDPSQIHQLLDAVTYRSQCQS